MTLKLGMKHQAMELYKVCTNHDPGMTLTFLRQGQLGSPMHLNGKNRKMSFNGRKLARNERMDRIFMFFENILGPVGCLPLPWGYIHVFDQNIQTSSSLKLLGQSKPNFMWNILGRGNESLDKWSRSHEQDGRQGYK